MICVRITQGICFNAYYMVLHPRPTEDFSEDGTWEYACQLLQKADFEMEFRMHKVYQEMLLGFKKKKTTCGGTKERKQDWCHAGALLAEPFVM